MSDQATKEELDALVKQFQTLKDHSARVDFLRKNPNALKSWTCCKLTKHILLIWII